jgi:hypothetical protein
MEFFYDTAIGAIDAIILVSVCAFGMFAGGPRTKIFAAVSFAVFLSYRAAWELLPHPVAMLAADAAAFAGLFVVLVATHGQPRVAVAALWACQMAILSLHLANVIPEEIMKPAVLVCVALQLIIVMGGGLDGTFRRISGRYRARPVRAMAPVESRGKRQ